MIYDHLECIDRLVHIIQLALRLVFADKDADDTASQHALPIDPRVHFHEQLSSVSTGGFHQFWFATWVERQVGSDVVDLALITRPSGLSFATSHCL